MRLALIALVLVAGASATRYTRTETYHGEQVLACKLHEALTDRFDEMVERLNLDVWAEHAEGIIDIRVAKESLKEVHEFFGGCEVKIADVEAHIQEDEIANNNHSVAPTDFFDAYHTYDEIIAYYRELTSTYSNVMTFIPSIGNSIQNRAMPAVRITAPGGGAKPSIYFQCQIHAREWISSATCAYVVTQLLENYAAGETRAVNILNNVVLHVVLFVNPDGYVFTWSGSRLWRKNRRANQGGSFGVDLNRNYDDHWGGPGSSPQPPSDTYRGTSPASEPETRNTVAYFRSAAPVIGAIDWHSYGNLILRPYGWSRNNAPDEARLNAIGAGIRTAILNTPGGQAYRNIKSIELYVTTGSASDWFYGAQAIGGNGGVFKPAGYTIELRGTSFTLPPAQIRPCGAENYNGVLSYITTLYQSPIRV